MGIKSSAFRDKSLLNNLMLFFLAMVVIGTVTLFTGGRFFEVTLYSIFLAPVVYLIRKYKLSKRKLSLEKKLKHFEAKRTEEIRRQVTDHPAFQTFCSDCRHFNRAVSGCGLDLHNRKSTIKLDYESKHGYCLYWNVESYPDPFKNKIMRPGSGTPQ